MNYQTSGTTQILEWASEVPESDSRIIFMLFRLSYQGVPFRKIIELKISESGSPILQRIKYAAEPLTPCCDHHSVQVFVHHAPALATMNLSQPHCQLSHLFAAVCLGRVCCTV